MRHLWGNARFIVRGIVRCNKQKTRCTKNKFIYSKYLLQWTVLNQIKSTWSVEWDCEAVSAELFRFPSFWLQTGTRERCDSRSGCWQSFLFLFFFWPSDMLRVKCGTCCICCLQSVPDCSLVQREQPSQVSGCSRSPWFSMIRDLGITKYQPFGEGNSRAASSGSTHWEKVC